jgi:hypothetical protein
VDDSFINSAAFRFLRLFLFLSRGNYVSAKLSGFLPIFSIFLKKSTNSAPADFLPGVEFSNTAIGPSVSCFVRGRYRMLPSDRIAALRVVKSTLQLTPPLFSCSCTLPSPESPALRPASMAAVDADAAEVERLYELGDRLSAKDKSEVPPSASASPKHSVPSHR